MRSLTVCHRLLIIQLCEEVFSPVPDENPIESKPTLRTVYFALTYNVFRFLPFVIPLFDMKRL